MEIKFKSVAWKWITNVFLVMFAIIFALEIIACVFIRSYNLSEAQNTAEEYAMVFITPLSNTQIDSFESSAREYCEGFEHKDKMEIQVLDQNGRMLMSTTGFAQAPSSMPDYDRAVTSSNSGTWTGRSSVGENVYKKLLYQNLYHHIPPKS